MSYLKEYSLYNSGFLVNQIVKSQTTLPVKLWYRMLYGNQQVCFILRRNQLMLQSK